jgi:CheY-like chemotaxis protein
MKKHILILEDDPDLLALLQRILLTAGYEVSSATDGRCVVENSFSIPDLILLEHSMPFIEGVALCKYLRIKPQTRDIPVVIISGNHSVHGRANSAGASSFLAKPFSVQELLRHINEAFKPVSKTEFQEA